MDRHSNNAKVYDGVRRALVLGAGRSGLAAALLLRERGVAVTVCDSASGQAQRDAAVTLAGCGCHVLTGISSLPAESFDLSVVSPGIPASSPWVSGLRDSGVTVISEIELGAGLAQFPLLAITGTNGKSTLVKFCADALKMAGCNAFACGNYGVPLCDVVRLHPETDWGVLEVSSFQMELTQQIHPRVAILLNIQPDHIDRHGSIEAYRALKMRLFSKMGSGDTLLVPEGECTHNEVPGEVTLLRFGSEESADIVYSAGEVTDRHSGDSIKIAQSWFDNPILGTAAAAGTAALQACGLNTMQIKEAFTGFSPPPHRMQEVGFFKGVRFVDDSKATNLAGMMAAMQMTSAPVRLIAGGVAKEKNLNKVKEFLVKSARSVYLIGSAAEDMMRSWRGAVPCRLCGTLEEAFSNAVEDAYPGETVLLSPGCASFDQFSDYAERGDRFSALVDGYVKGCSTVVNDTEGG